MSYLVFCCALFLDSPAINIVCGRLVLNLKKIPAFLSVTVFVATQFPQDCAPRSHPTSLYGLLGSIIGNHFTLACNKILYTYM